MMLLSDVVVVVVVDRLVLCLICHHLLCVVAILTQRESQLIHCIISYLPFLIMLISGLWLRLLLTEEIFVATVLDLVVLLVTSIN